MDYYQLFVHKYEDVASDIDKSLIAKLNDISNEAFEEMRSVEKEYISKLNQIFDKHYPNAHLTCTSLDSPLMHISIPETNEMSGERTFCIRYNAKCNSDGIVIGVDFEDDCRDTYEKAFVRRKWGFELLHINDFQNDVSKILIEMLNITKPYDDICTGCYRMMADLICKYES